MCSGYYSPESNCANYLPGEIERGFCDKLGRVHDCLSFKKDEVTYSKLKEPSITDNKSYFDRTYVSPSCLYCRNFEEIKPVKDTIDSLYEKYSFLREKFEKEVVEIDNKILLLNSKL